MPTTLHLPAWPRPVVRTSVRTARIGMSPQRLASPLVGIQFRKCSNPVQSGKQEVFPIPLRKNSPPTRFVRPNAVRWGLHRRFRPHLKPLKSEAANHQSGGRKTMCRDLTTSMELKSEAANQSGGRWNVAHRRALGNPIPARRSLSEPLSSAAAKAKHLTTPNTSVTSLGNW